MSDDLVETVAKELWRPVNENDYEAAAKAAIATVLREMIEKSKPVPYAAQRWPIEERPVPKFIRAFAAEHNIALDHIGEGKEGEKDD